MIFSEFNGWHFDIHWHSTTKKETKKWLKNQLFGSVKFEQSRIINFAGWILMKSEFVHRFQCSQFACLLTSWTLNISVHSAFFLLLLIQITVISFIFSFLKHFGALLKALHDYYNSFGIPFVRVIWVFFCLTLVLVPVIFRRLTFVCLFGVFPSFSIHFMWNIQCRFAFDSFVFFLYVRWCCSFIVNKEWSV